MAGKSEHVAGILEAANFYARLGLEEDTAEPAAVRSAYRSLALKVHPDKCGDPGATEAFKLLSEAFECLYDSEQQNAYLTNLQVPSELGALGGPSQALPAVAPGGHSTHTCPP